jgi:hypothetical protein
VFIHEDFFFRTPLLPTTLVWPELSGVVAEAEDAAVNGI